MTAAFEKTTPNIWNTVFVGSCVEGRSEGVVDSAGKGIFLVFCWTNTGIIMGAGSRNGGCWRQTRISFCVLLGKIMELLWKVTVIY